MSLASDVITDLGVNGQVEAFKGMTEFLGTVGTRMSKEFMKEGIDVGQTIRIVLPPRPNPWITGRVITPAATEYEQVSLTVLQKNTSRIISDADLQLNRREFFEECIAPDVNGGVREAEINAITAMYTQPTMSNIDTVGANATNSQVWGNTMAKYRMMVGPNKDVFGMMDPITMQLLANNESRLFRPEELVDVAALEGRVQRLAGVGKMFDNINITNFTNGDGSTTGVLVAGSNQTGTSLNVDTVAAGATYKAGQQFYFSDAGKGNALDPEKHYALPFKQIFTLTQDCAISGNAATLVFAPAIIISGSLQNQLLAPADDAAVTFLGDASGVYQQSFLYHGGEKGAIDFVGLQLPTFEGRGGTSKMKRYKEVPLRTVYFTDYKEGQNYLRLDQMTGLVINRWQHVWRQWGAKVT